jgi:hypothetical protein
MVVSTCGLVTAQPYRRALETVASRAVLLRKDIRNTEEMSIGKPQGTKNMKAILNIVFRLPIFFSKLAVSESGAVFVFSEAGNVAT